MWSFKVADINLSTIYQYGGEGIVARNKITNVNIVNYLDINILFYV